MAKITKHLGIAKPEVTQPECASGTENCGEELETECPGINSKPYSRKPVKSRRKPVPQIQSPATLTEPISKLDPTDALFASTVDGPETDNWG